ncbi:MAG: glycosyltransferase family 39 protein [Dysgonamonadaceae bacterium]|jgi:hypothetical protein|nr:glycosyltransferase family 39 protein [Dysgonamonadaceae bacterium]
MLYFGLFLTIALGFVFVHCLSVKFTLIEKAGLSFPLGMAFTCLLMLLLDQVNIPLTPMPLLTSQALLLAGLIFVVYFCRKDAWSSLLESVSRSSLKDINPVWLLFILAVVYMEYMNFSKCMYFPPSDRDSLTAFETIGYIAAREHTFKGLSIFDESYMPHIHGTASSIVYAPLVQLSYAYVYTLEAETSKIIPALMYLFFLAAFYGAAARAAGKTGAAVATFFMLLTPEMLAWSSLSMTNVIHAVFASLSVIYMSLWFQTREKKDLLLCGSLLGGNILSRNEGIVFTAAVLLLLFIDTLRSKRYWGFAQAALWALVPLVVWTLYTKMNGLYAEGIVVKHLFWDAEKAGTIASYMWGLYNFTQYYGWSFIVFLIAFLANLWFLIRKKDSLYLLLAIGLSSLFYMLILYQIDYKWDSMHNVLSYSAKRFLFCFIPMVWYFAFTNHTVSALFRRLEGFLLLRRQ